MEFIFERLYVIRNKQILLPFIIFIIGISGYLALNYFKTAPKEKAKRNNIPVIAIENIDIKPLTLTVASYGLALPKYETELVSQVSGEVTELASAFVRGGFVKKGDLLARIDPSDYEAELINAQATMANARAALEQEIAQGKVAEREWKRIKDTSPTQLSLRKPQLAQELARVKSAQAAELVAKRNLERTEIRAPYDALIDTRNIGLGSFVRSGTLLGKVLGVDVAEIRLPVANKQFTFLINEGLNAPVTLVAESAGEVHQWQATIIRSEGVVDSDSRMTYLVAAVADPYLLKTELTDPAEREKLKFGTYINARIEGIKLPSATKVPRFLVKNNKVPTLAPNNTIDFKPVVILRQDEGEVIITEGLAQDDKLIVSALDYPFDGMKVSLPSLTDQEQMKIKDKGALSSLKNDSSTPQSLKANES